MRSECACKRLQHPTAVLRDAGGWGRPPGPHLPDRPQISWRPRDEVYAMLSQFGVPREFAQEQIPEFVLYWNERGTERHSWGNKFYKHVLHEWRRSQASTAVARPVSAMSHSWRPSQDAVSILQERGIPNQLIAQEVAPFILYWRDRGDACSTWDSKFVAHVLHSQVTRRQQPVQQRSLVEDLTDRSWAHNGGSNGED